MTSLSRYSRTVLFIFLFSLIRPGEDLRCTDHHRGSGHIQVVLEFIDGRHAHAEQHPFESQRERVRTRVIVIAGVMKSSLDSLFLTIFAGARIMIVFFEDVGYG